MLTILPSLEWSYKIKASVLRYTFHIKHKLYLDKSQLPHWDIALDNFRKKLDELGINCPELFIGLE